MNWFDLIQKLLSVAVNILKLHDYCLDFKQWLRAGNRQSFGNKVNQFLKGLAIVETALLVCLLLLSGTEFLIRNYSPAMPASALMHLGKDTLGGVAVGGWAIKGFWHYLMKLASL